MIEPVIPGPMDGPAPDRGKDATAFRTIGEVANALGIRQHVLRYWEEQFPTLQPLTRAGGRRYYRPADVALITEIDRLLNHEGYTIKGAKQALRSGQAKTASAASPAGEAEAAAQLEAQFSAILQAMRSRLSAALED